ncbi:MAG: secretin N-terminal domain-containing protein [Candidatus Eisenbacteria bacterium]
MRRLVALLALAAVLAAGAPAGARDGSTASFSFRDTRAQDALRLVAVQFGYSFVMGQPVSGTFTATLTDLTFEESVSYVAEATGCDYRIDGKVLVVNPAALRSAVFPLRYIDSKAAADAVASVVSEKGTVAPFTGGGVGSVISASTKENALIVTDTPARLEAVLAVLERLDRRPQLIAIEAKLVETTLGSEERLGLDWQMRASAKGAVMPHTFPFPKDAGSGDFTAESNPNNQIGGGGPAFPPGQSFPYASPGDFTFGKLSFQEFSLTMELLKQQSSTNLVSAPKVTTLDNQQAEIVVGTVVPIARYERHKETGVLEVIGYDEKKVGVRLLVTPHVGADSTLVLSVSPEISEILEYRGQFNERPVTATRSATTQVVMKGGETVMIGGLIKEVDVKTTRKVPFLGDIPLLGALFKHKTTSKQKVDLMIFITPHLISP